MKNITTVILAAGRSTRFVSNKSKLTHELAGYPIINHVFDTAKKISGKNIIVVCNKDNFDELKNILIGCKFVIQKNQRGTADAIEVAKQHIKTKNFIILFGDVPLITDQSLKKLIRSFKNNNSSSMIAFKTFKPKGYGRVILKNNKVIKVVEEINASPNEKLIEFCNSGIMLVQKSSFYKNIKLIKFNKKKKERYLTDIFEIYFNKNIPFSFVVSSEDEMSGVNNLNDFNKVDSLFQNRLVNKFLEQGVLIKKPETSYFSYNAKIAKKVIIEPNVIIRNNVTIKSGSIIKSYSDLDGVLINEDCSIGPHARIRPHSIINKSSKIGNYVEIKNSFVGKNTSISHLTYIGDSKIGNKVNIGAFGDAGCLITKNKKLASISRALANHGSSSKNKHDHIYEGINSRMDGIQAAILNIKLNYITKWNLKRKNIALKYFKYLSDNKNIILPSLNKHENSVFHLYVIKVKNRKYLIEKLEQNKIGYGIHYPKALPNLTAYSYLKTKKNKIQVATSLEEKILSLPIYPELNNVQIKKVCQIINKYTK